MNKVIRLANHLRKYLLPYVLLAIAVAVPIGYFYAGFFKSHASEIKTAILLLAVATLYPSMVQLRAEKIVSELKTKPKETLFGLLLVFLIAPVLAMLLAYFMENKMVGIGFVAANAVPASSASMAYVMLAEGNIELATALAILSIFGAIVLAPIYVGFYAATVAVSIPLVVLAESVTIALVTPFILGQLTRYYLVKHQAKKIIKDRQIDHPCKKAIQLHQHIGIEEVIAHIEEAIECIEGEISKSLKPYLSLATMMSMLLLIAVLIANKSVLLIEKPIIAADIIGSQLAIYSVIIFLLLIVSRIAKIRYEDHMGIAFIAITKNQSVAAAMAVMAIGTTAALPAALIPAIQPVIAIIYVTLAPIVAKILGQPEAVKSL